MAVKSDTKQRKISKKELRKRELARQKRKRILLTWVPIGSVVVALVALVIFRLIQPDLEGVIKFDDLSSNHDREATFADTGLPPTGGSHNPSWQNCGIYETPVDSSLSVHSLEHGAVWLTYRPDLPAEKVAALQDLARGQSYVLMSPYPGLESEVVMSAWGRQLVIDTLPDEQVEQFIERYQGQGPESGARCSGGVGTPLN